VTPIQAAVLITPGAPLEVHEITLPELGPRDVRVRMAAAGVCHSDLSLASGKLRQKVPAVLGHEGSGTVVAVGSEVTTVNVGDAVVLSWSPPCRTCWFCLNDEPYLCAHAGDRGMHPYATLADGTPVYPGLSTGAFAEEAVLPQRAVIPISAGVSFENAAIAGCAVLTGVGAVLNSARVRAGESMCVIGLGGVGLSVLQGGRLAGAGPIIAVDASLQKEALARELGATHFIPASDDVHKQVRDLTEGRGVDQAFEVVGLPSTILQAWRATRRGGAVTVLGVPGGGQEVAFGALELWHYSRTIRPSFFGSSDPDRDLPTIFDHVTAGRLDLDAMITDEIGLEDLPAAFDRMLQGEGARSVVRFPQAGV
jgi:S-(hydroxymethyl)glutathione dehydrogenase / alcohol dehydrogenase